MCLYHTVFKSHPTRHRDDHSKKNKCLVIAVMIFFEIYINYLTKITFIITSF